MNIVLIGPHRSECTSSKILVAQVPPYVGNGHLVCLPWTYIHLHANESTSPCIPSMSIPLTML